MHHSAHLSLSLTHTHTSASLRRLFPTAHSGARQSWKDPFEAIRDAPHLSLSHTQTHTHTHTQICITPLPFSNGSQQRLMIVKGTNLKRFAMRHTACCSRASHRNGPFISQRSQEASGAGSRRCLVLAKVSFTVSLCSQFSSKLILENMCFVFICVFVCGCEHICICIEIYVYEYIYVWIFVPILYA